MRLFRQRPVRLQPFFGYRSRDRLVLAARALRRRAPVFEAHTRWRAVRTVLGQFAPGEVAGLAVRLEVRGEGGLILRQEQLSDAAGFVRFDCPLDPAWDLPDQPQWELASLSWTSSAGPQVVYARILVPGRDSELAVISDIDDTIIETGITGGLGSVVRNWRRIFAQLPHERIAVPHADSFYGELGGGTSDRPTGRQRPVLSLPAPRRPFFYVSSSPWNLYNYLVAFQRTKNLPLGPLLLRAWGLNKDTLGQESHGAHKLTAIESVLAMYPGLRFALIGDDTQGDLPAFAQLVANRPGRIAAVFLRTVSEQSFSAEEEAALAAIRAAGVPLWLGDSFSVGAEFLHTLGFTPGGETEQIVRAVEGYGAHGDTPPAIA